jgi:hypothetical protein
VRPDIGALVDPEFVVEAEDFAALVDRGVHMMELAARVVGGDQMLVSVLDPFDGTPEAERRGADEHVLGIKLAAHPEPAADMPFVQMDPVEREPEHLRQRLPVVMRHLGGAVEPQDAAFFLGNGDGAARLERHAAVPADREVEREDRMRGGESRIEVAVLLAHDRRLGARLARVEIGRERLDLWDDEMGDVLGRVRVGGEDRGERLADIAHMPLSQHALPIGL